MEMRRELQKKECRGQEYEMEDGEENGEDNRKRMGFEKMKKKKEEEEEEYD